MKVTEYIKNKEISQPKKEIAEFIQSEFGILIPKIYDDAEAFNLIEKGENFLLRSEHPQELSGDSGILYTYKSKELDNFYKTLNEETTGFKTFFYSKNKKKQIIQNIKNELIKTWKIEDYCKLKNIDENEFIKNISYSNWEKIEGFNGMIIADDSVENKYHIMGMGILSDSYKQIYSQIENGFIKKDFKLNNINRYINIEELIEMYDKIRLKSDCPIVEFQIDYKKNLYFLQYHKVREFEKADFKLDRELEVNEIVTDVVRGKTPKNGLEVKLRTSTDEKKAHLNYICSESLENEVCSKGRDVEIYAWKDSVAHELVIGHSGRTPFFKPKISAEFNLKQLYSDDEIFEGELNVRIISDGNKAYLKKLD